MRLVAIGSMFVSEKPHPALWSVDELMAYLMHAGKYRRDWHYTENKLYATEEVLSKASWLLESDLQVQASHWLSRRK